MRKSLQDVKALARAAVARSVEAALADSIAENCAWLEGAGYPGLKLLAEALEDPGRSLYLEADALGVDLQNVSCVFLAPQLDGMVKAGGRLFLRNVRHGLYLVPPSVSGNYGIGCPVDPAFALGGERAKNPYAEKLEAAARDGVEVDEALWQSLGG